MFGQDQRTLFFLLVYDKENYNLYVSVKPISNHKLRDGERKSSLSIYCVVVIYSFQNTIHHYDFILILITSPCSAQLEFISKVMSSETRAWLILAFN